MSTNKNNYPAMRYIKFTINTKKKYEDLLKIIKDINSCDYYISCEICCETKTCRIDKDEYFNRR